jgi:hypothetical protein
MKAFLSYSLNDTDQYILTLLANELKKRGFTLNQSNDFNMEMSSLTKVNINKSQVFIGLITGDGQEKERVQKEWRLANIANISSILMIENTVPISSDFNFPYILFDRLNPQKAIDKLNSKTTSIKKSTEQDSNGWAWILGGAAILAIIGLLSRNDK